MSASVGARPLRAVKRAWGKQAPLADQRRPGGGAVRVARSVPEHAEAGAGRASKGRTDRPPRHRAGNGTAAAAAYSTSIIHITSRRITNITRNSSIHGSRISIYADIDRSSHPDGKPTSTAIATTLNNS